MIEAYVGINNEVTLASIKAVRTKPKSCKVEPGTECTYTLYVYNQPVDTMTNKFGCGIDLAIHMLELYKKNEKRYKIKALVLNEEKEHNKLFQDIH